MCHVLWLPFWDHFNWCFRREKATWGVTLRDDGCFREQWQSPVLCSWMPAASLPISPQQRGIKWPTRGRLSADVGLVAEAWEHARCSSACSRGGQAPATSHHFGGRKEAGEGQFSTSGQRDAWSPGKGTLGLMVKGHLVSW